MSDLTRKYLTLWVLQPHGHLPGPRHDHAQICAAGGFIETAACAKPDFSVNPFSWDSGGGSGGGRWFTFCEAAGPAVPAQYGPAAITGRVEHDRKNGRSLDDGRGLGRGRDTGDPPPVTLQQAGAGGGGAIQDGASSGAGCDWGDMRPGVASGPLALPTAGTAQPLSLPHSFLEAPGRRSGASALTTPPPPGHDQRSPTRTAPSRRPPRYRRTLLLSATLVKLRLRPAVLHSPPPRGQCPQRRERRQLRVPISTRIRSGPTGRTGSRLIGSQRSPRRPSAGPFTPRSWTPAVAHAAAQ